MKFGRFTLDGSPELESKLNLIVQEVAEVTTSIIREKDIHALILLGGYGRGEGGIVTQNGIEQPHNNLDFLLITRSESSQKQNEIKIAWDDMLKPIAVKHGIGIDTGTIGRMRLTFSQTLVMWYDMRFGHKTILGDKTFVPGLSHFRAERIPASNMRDLMINRGSLLVINQIALEQGSPNLSIRKLIVKHTIKAIIGYGDNLLFNLGQYHWSYAEKQRRIANLAQIPEEFRSIYDEAINFRFRPDYDSFKQSDLDLWLNEVTDILGRIHLWCESNRLKTPFLDWKTYGQLALKRNLLIALRDPSMIIRRLKSVIRNNKNIRKSTSGNNRLRWLDQHDQLALTLPYAAGLTSDARMKELAGSVLGDPEDSLYNMRINYLNLWGKVGDPNYDFSLSQPQTTDEIEESTI